jgi:glycogen debranching enzyme
LRNHGWKDSVDSVSHANGRLAEPPLALIEIQAYAFRAWKDLARLARIRGDTLLAEQCEARAQQLREIVDREFWMEDESTYGAALDGDSRLCRIVTSNAGHCLFAGLPTLDRAARLAQRLRQPDLSSGHGLRTLSTRERRYNPMSYHNGTVWPHDNALVCEGLRRYGLLQAMSEIHQEVLSAIYTFPLRRVPELYCGFDRLLVREPIPYPAACSPQAWSSGALLMMVTQMMGLTVDGRNRRLIFTQIRLPEPIEWIRVHRMRVGDAEIHFTVDRGGSVEVDHRSAPLDVTIHK